jgi:hypothetical protein
MPVLVPMVPRVPRLPRVPDVVVAALPARMSVVRFEGKDPLVVELTALTRRPVSTAPLVPALSS